MSAFKSDSVGNSSESVYGSYSFIHDDVPCKGNTSTTNLGPDAKRWINHRGPGRDYSHDQQNVLDAEVKLLSARYVNGIAKASEENQLIEEFYTTFPKADTALSSDVPLEQFYSHCKDTADSWLQDFESTMNDDLLSDAHVLDLESCNSLLLERPKKLCSDGDSHLIGLKKIEPWWHSADKDDFASLVTQTSSHHFSKCDHPGVKSMHVEKVSDNCLDYFDKFKEQMTDKETKVPQMVKCTQRNLTSASMVKSQGKQGLEGILQSSDGTFSSSDGFNKAKVDSSDGDLSRAELLEALCHSQTRARQAEKLAQEACDEKDNIINLFFQQASCLFAYRQWLRLLQLETLCIHLRSKDQLSSFTAPTLLPRPSKGMNLRKNRPSAAKKKLGKHRSCIRKLAIAYAVGLGLAGAGLLVGWTIGWLFRSL